MNGTAAVINNPEVMSTSLKVQMGTRKRAITYGRI
jgi:hypothetical protein